MTETITDKMTEEQLEKLRAKRREAQRRWRAKNKDKVREYARRKRIKNREKLRKMYHDRYWSNHEENKAKARERWRAKHPHMQKLTPMYKGAPKAPRPTKYHEFDRDKLGAHRMTIQEKKEVKELKNKLVALDRLWNIRRIELERYIRERSILLTKIKKYDKTYCTHDE